ncbi:MAG: hypothetical protein HY537_09730 [Deltaproteobacteria bacterium]|nr:hypothetical protein [Deltaproteobacteria bacterium]
MKFIWLIVCLIGYCAYGAEGPFLVESKVQGDLDTALAKIVPSDQFLVQVSADVTTKTERKVVEGETIVTSQNSEQEIAVAPMPGFVPEPEFKVAKPPLQNRQVFRLIETPVLAALRINVNFDDSLPPDVIVNGRELVRSYARSHYPQVSSIVFGRIKMIKLKKEQSLEPTPSPTPTVTPEPNAKKEPLPLSPEEQLWGYARWIVLGILVAILLLTVLQVGLNSAKKTDSQASQNANQHTRPSLLPSFLQPWAPADREQRPEAKTETYSPIINQRARLLDRFLSKADTFREYYGKLNSENQAQLCSVLKGAALDSLFESLNIKSPEDAGPPPGNADEILANHEKEFSELIKAREWKEKQFFGFLQGVSDEQLITLVTHESPVAISVMLRFMKPAQAARTIESLPPAMRAEVLSCAHGTRTTSISDLLQIERDARTVIQKLPSYASGASKGDSEFWGSILNEASNQDDILDALKDTNPKIYPGLAKYKFKLENAATLSKEKLQKVLSEIDNDELCLALAGCSDETAKVLLGAVSTKRRDLVMAQMSAYEGADESSIHTAKMILTRKMREVIG